MNRKRLLFVVAALALGLVGAVGLGVVLGGNPYLHPSPYYPTIRANAAPIIAALRHYARDHGKPPRALAELVPEYLSHIPQTGYPPQSEYEYAVQTESYMGLGWYLIVYTDKYLGLEPDLILYNSSYDGWVVDE